MLDWSSCPAVERDPERVSGAWVFRSTRVPVSALFENLEGGAQITEFVEWFPGVSIEQVRTIQEVAVGGYHEMVIPLPALLTSVLLSGTDRFMVAHNHPSGDATPSADDRAITRRLAGAAEMLGIELVDHVIVAAGGWASLRESGECLPGLGSWRRRERERVLFSQFDVGGVGGCAQGLRCAQRVEWSPRSGDAGSLRDPRPTRACRSSRQQSL